MNKIKKMLWMTAGFIFVGIAYIGVVTPGIPWSTPSLMAAYCFSKSSERFHNWIMNHKLFGPFIINWKNKRVFPTLGKFAMFITMDISLIVLWFTTYNLKAVAYLAVTFLLINIWAYRFPGSEEEYERRKKAGEKIGWLK
jgi:uncharacterized membrane protein YbaN (DUF454 family)